MSSFESAIEEVVDMHPEYAREAYVFMREALDSSVVRYGKEEGRHHLSAKELYYGACYYALQEYGPLAEAVLAGWGIRTPQDFGNVVYYLIEVGIFGRSHNDRKDQFNDLPALSHLLDEPFRY